MRGATTPPEVARWARVVKAVVPCFPIATLLLAATGAYMAQEQWGWTTPWIDAGIAGLVLLVVCGSVVEAGRGRALEREVRAAGLSPRAHALLRDPAAWSAKLTTFTLMLGIVFLMVTKPAGLGRPAGSATAAVGEPGQPAAADPSRDGGPGSARRGTHQSPDRLAVVHVGTNGRHHHVSAVLQKLGQPNRSSAVAVAVRQGILPTRRPDPARV